MKGKKHLATVSILVKDRQMHAADVQRILTDAGHLVMARLGVNVQRQCIEHCTGFIVIAVEGKAADIRALTKSLNELYGVVAKECLMTD